MHEDEDELVSLTRVLSAGYSLPEAAAACPGLSRGLHTHLQTAPSTVGKLHTRAPRGASPSAPTAHLTAH
eukprot:CAMPEP_0118812672 /NCGR_PEP_ID=MMETSP1162-20130426/2462_1 /TAXON_ID=33656 /ORGANISM="Phaeocystis Sp, Strain CCMP2710" /LENGTH=69 /DNA_ID=CAMNT_0006742411 /DNA_START=85 /DNA_END=291 /DNA_ORIENTATION=+